MASKLIKKDSLSNTDTAWSGYTNRVGIQHSLLLEGQLLVSATRDGSSLPCNSKPNTSIIPIMVI